jgi:RNA polymerase sigma factor (sigma-70 family)
MPQKISPDTDQQLWLAFKKGDHQAFTQIIQRYFKPLFIYAIRLNHNEDLIRDCIQDVFCECWKKREVLSYAESVKSYLFTAVRNRIYREQKKWSNTIELDNACFFDAHISIETQIIEDQDTWELKNKFEKLLNNMPARQKEILYLRFYENMDYERIAKIMGLNKQVAYNLLHKSVLRLRKDWVEVLFATILIHFI